MYWEHDEVGQSSAGAEAAKSAEEQIRTFC